MLDLRSMTVVVLFLLAASAPDIYFLFFMISSKVISVSTMTGLGCTTYFSALDNASAACGSGSTERSTSDLDFSFCFVASVTDAELVSVALRVAAGIGGGVALSLGAATIAGEGTGVINESAFLASSGDVVGVVTVAFSALSVREDLVSTFGTSLGTVDWTAAGLVLDCAKLGELIDASSLVTGLLTFPVGLSVVFGTILGLSRESCGVSG